MYAEEYLPDDDIDYLDVSVISIEETSSIDTQIRDQRKMRELYKRTDKDYYTYKVMNFDGESVKLEKIELYSSPLTCNGYIRNAATGIRMEHRAGSKYNDLYFTMMDVANGTHSDLNNEPRKLFYSNPEECERHQKINIPQKIKEEWREKYMRAKAIL